MLKRFMILRSGLIKGRSFIMGEPATENESQIKDVERTQDADSGIGKSIEGSVGISGAAHSTPIVGRIKADESGNALLQLLQEMKAMGDSINHTITEKVNGVEGKLASFQQYNARLIEEIKIGLEKKVESRIVPLENEIITVERQASKNESDISGLDVKFDMERTRTEVRFGQVDKRVKLVEGAVVTLSREVKEVVEEVANGGYRSCGTNSVGTTIQINSEKPKFDGSRRALHPIKFMKKLDEYLDMMRTKGRRQLVTAIECLEGDVRIWAECNSHDWSGLEDFKRSFVKQYWSQKAQEKVRAELYRPRVYNSRYGSYTHHVWYWVDKTQHLEPAVSEEILVTALSKHFPLSVERTLISAMIKTKEDLLEVLSRIEDNEREGENSNGNNRYGDNNGRNFINNNNRNRQQEDFRANNNNSYERRDNLRGRGRGAYAVQFSGRSSPPRRYNSPRRQVSDQGN